MGWKLTTCFFLAAKAALRRKKAHEHSLEQTLAQIGTLEQQINAIESANINRETLAAMERAGEAMQQIHGKLTPEKVDETMYAHIPYVYRLCDPILVADVDRQEQTTRTQPTERGDLQRHYEHQSGRAYRRDRFGRRARADSTRATRRTDAQVGDSAGVGCHQPDARRCKWRK